MSLNVFSIHNNDTLCTELSMGVQVTHVFSKNYYKNKKDFKKYIYVPKINDSTPTNDNHNPVDETTETADANDYFDSSEEDDDANLAYQFESDDESLSESGNDQVEGPNTYQSTSVFNSNPLYPFKNEMEMKILMFFKGSRDRTSIRLIKKTTHLLRELITISHQERDYIQQKLEGFNPLRNVTKDDHISKSHDTRRKFPRLEVDEATIPNEYDRSVELFFIKPSHHLRLLPDFTPNQCYHLNQRRKREDNKHFQSPLVAKEFTNADTNFWIGDVVSTRPNQRQRQQQLYIIAKFLTVNDGLFVNVFPNDFTDNFLSAVIDSTGSNISVTDILFCMTVLQLHEHCHPRLCSKIIDNNGEDQGLITHVDLVIGKLIPTPMTIGKKPIALRYSSETYNAESRALENFLSFVNPEQPERASPVYLPNKGRVTSQGNIKEAGSSNKWGKIGFKLTGTEGLLKLKAVDSSQDLSVEILQTLLLGITKYCFKLAHDFFLNVEQLQLLT
ncbi:uncharacterized protein EV154DRAFT_486302 [Mucor mucedo]|uniref:uncharacterized protein n=1 Tax=Mucor mucedo TaxID=29922 RepID=UPI00221FC2B0|nr:uncharacterized protein EV154DRAFT_486302 [Mucor mucedo]KAI7877679.1 hypothetical protein EV154DRAFT_486302 [Mucor mucedo]